MEFYLDSRSRAVYWVYLKPYSSFAPDLRLAESLYQTHLYCRSQNYLSFQTTIIIRQVYLKPGESGREQQPSVKMHVTA